MAFALLSALLLLPLMSQPMWRDEGTTFLSISQHGLAAVLDHVRMGELTPPLYFMLEYAWANLTGTSEFALRLPSLVAMSLTAGLLYLTATRIGGRVAGYATATCACIAPMSLFAGTDARPYALTLFLSASVLALIASLLSDERAAIALPATALAIAVAALGWTHYTAWVAIAGLIVVTPVVGWGRSPQRRIAYLVAIAAGAALAALLLRDFTSVAGTTPRTSAGHATVDLLHEIDARLVWFNPLLIAEPVFVALFVGGSAVWLIHAVRSLRLARLSTEDQFLAVCLSVAACGVGASVVFRVPPHLHLAAYAPAVWLIIGNYYARVAARFGRPSDLRGAGVSQRLGLAALAAVTIFTLFAFPITYWYEYQPRSGSRALVHELDRLVPGDVTLIAVPDALSPSLKYDLRDRPATRLQGMPTWSRPWYNGSITRIDPGEKRALIARIDDVAKHCERVAFAVDWGWKYQTDAFHIRTGSSYDVARSIVREESALRGVAVHRSFPGTFETMDLVLLAPACAERRMAGAGPSASIRSGDVR